MEIAAFSAIAIARNIKAILCDENDNACTYISNVSNFQCGLTENIIYKSERSLRELLEHLDTYIKQKFDEYISRPN